MTNAPQKFRKMPIQIEAMQFEGGAESATEVIDWILSGDGTARYWEPREELRAENGEITAPAQEECVRINTLEGVMSASVGDWVIKGIQGEFYPCKPDIFEDSYLTVGEDAPRKSITIDWPRILPEGTPVTKKDVMAAWREFVTPLQEAGRNGELNVKTLAAVFRHVYSEMPEDKK